MPTCRLRLKSTPGTTVYSYIIDHASAPFSLLLLETSPKLGRWGGAPCSVVSTDFASRVENQPPVTACRGVDKGESISSTLGCGKYQARGTQGGKEGGGEGDSNLDIDDTS